MHTGDGATARRYLEQGFLMVTVTNELGLITVGAAAEMAIARGEAVVDGRGGRGLASDRTGREEDEG